MLSVAIIGSGPAELIPDLSKYREEIDIWIGADRGALVAIQNHLKLAHAIGDFDSVDETELLTIKNYAKHIELYPVEKDKTDLELALQKALSLSPSTVYLMGVTGGRMDHTLINIQLLNQLKEENIHGIIVDQYNRIEQFHPGTHMVERDATYPTISFVPLTTEVKGLTLKGFYYPLTEATIIMGSTLSISNKLIANSGTFSFMKGIVLVVRSRG
ncbi:thiamine diphosphokinase [Ornithinibacillus scapharcae]|uniref:thiamine diphosphokinase n=1 Tax=Ornithinibacillus scapharcae TaxID=1147159 RepID=UPI000225BE09|nr:thiamine diphosphokinase [Ornithinibacillus scapharcae]